MTPLSDALTAAQRSALAALYDLTGRDDSRPVPLEATESDPERTEA